MISKNSKKGITVYNDKYGNGVLYAKSIEDENLFLVDFTFQNGHGNRFINITELTETKIENGKIVKIEFVEPINQKVSLNVHRCHWCGESVVETPTSLNIIKPIIILCKDCLNYEQPHGSIVITKLELNRQKEVYKKEYINDKWYSCGHAVKEIIINMSDETLSEYLDWKNDNPKNLCLECWLKSKIISDFCKLKNKKCKYAEKRDDGTKMGFYPNNEHIGYGCCGGEYCD